jgi:CheY-like chemotaxis protein
MQQDNQEPAFRKVLIIDDTHMDRYVAERTIRKYHFAEEVVTKESARIALNYLKELTATPELLPDFIFLDIRMPEIDGFGFLTEYSKLPEVVRLKCIIVMLSSSLSPEDHLKAASNSFVNRFLQKPLSQEQLAEIAGQLGH